jgi:ubiquinone/menaquinone biosynthesis C-methylase UbiE
VESANFGAQRDAGHFASGNEPPATPGATEILHRDGRATLSALANGKRRLRVEMSRPGAYVRRAEWNTAYPDWLIRVVLEAKGLAYLCDEIMRDEDPNYIRRHVELTVTAHVDPQELAGGEVLDFGCGAGASTVILSKLLPSSNITGVELSEQNLSIARARAEFYELHRTRLLLSPRENALPEGIGPFRAVMLSAVFEHLLPAERRTLLPMLWRLLEPGGVMFIDETPSRWFPIETHTTGLPFINYLPDRLAAAYARRCSRRVRRDHSWDVMCRNGIRGGSVTEILGLLPAADGRPILLEPHRLGIKDPIDLWFRGYATDNGRVGAMKRKATPLLQIAARFVDSTSLVPYLSLAIRKASA